MAIAILKILNNDLKSLRILKDYLAGVRMLNNKHLFNKKPIMLKNLSAWCLSAALLSGCQQTAGNKTAPPASDHQLAQLSSLVGAAQFLRVKCNRADIPADDKLAGAALSAADKKGWPSRAIDRSRLSEAANGVFERLNADATPLSEKCSRLNQSLAQFLAQTR
ncbi:type II secretion system pilot lipoprotein GspS [Serratia entomophila]|uniref:type II secretion system pilot lipoprotein GspS n=1 Tax=Serratia entomophila TaxID=42906 RepID=UPI0021BA45D3|nr:type II secretion system pilot lipoprotein GspS [Serratia entomophila]